MDSNESGETAVTRFGNFEVLRNPEGALHLLGGGGFGKTYKARHVYLNQIVALKVINDRFLQDNSIKERFLREAQVVHQLRHPHIAHVIDFGEVRHSLYYAMEFCGGGNLENMVSRIGGPLPLPGVLRCARQLTEALGCAHAHGFIHRDVKPANVMLTGSDDARPELKLVDFGLVKHLQGGGSEATAALTMTGQQFFTIQFASPEQLMEEELDARSDIFALGMTIWFLLKGAAPEAGSMASIVAKRLDGRSYEPLLPTNVPPAYRAILARLLEKDRSLRFQNTDEVLAALAAAEAVPDVSPAGDAAAAAGETTDLELVPPVRSAPASGPPPIAEFYTVLENIGPMPLGVLYRATANGDHEQVAVTMIGEALCEDPAQRATIEKNVAVLKTQGHETIARVYGLEEYQEGLALVQEWHRGISLQSILKHAGFLGYGDALRVLLPIAQGTDWTTGRGLPGVVLAMDEIYLQPLDAGADPEPAQLLHTPLRNWPPFRVRLLPYVIREDPVQDIGRTINTEMVTDPNVAFACLLYHLVAGHTPKAAARLSKLAYVTIGRFAEDSNRLLAACIASEQDFGGCEGILRALNANEGIGFPLSPSPSSTEASRAILGGFPANGPVADPASRSLPGSRPGTTKTGLPPAGPPQTDTGSNRGLPVVAKGDARSGGIVVETRRLPQAGGGSITNRSSRDLVREAEEARLKKEAEEAQLRRQQADEERARQEAEEARLRKQQADEARAKKQADDERARQEAEERRLRKQQADEEQARQDAEEKRLRKQQADEARARQDAEAQRLRQKQAEEAKAKKLADEERARQEAEAKRLRKQQADEERARQEAEEKQRKQRLAEEARTRQLADERARQEAEANRAQQRQAEAARAKQLADEARAKKLADEERARQDAEEKRLRKQQADEARARQEAEAQQLRQKQAEAARAKSLAVQTPPQAAVPESERLARAPATVEDADEKRPRTGGLPPGVWLAAIAACVALVAVVALAVLPKPAPTRRIDPTPPPVAVHTPTPPPVVVSTPVPPPGQFVFARGITLAQGGDPTKAVVQINGQAVKSTVQDGKTVVPLAGVGAGAVVSVAAPGYETRTFPITGSTTVNEPVELRRQQGEVAFRLQDGTCDYATAVFKPIQALPGDQTCVRLDTFDTTLTLAADAKRALPTGIYQVTLLGPSSATNIQPRVLEPHFNVAAQQGNVLTLPPSFVGRYDFNFMFSQMNVRRVIVLDPGLTTGHVDDYGNDTPAKDTKVTGLSLDGRGVLHGVIRFLARDDINMGPDEQFELSYADNHFAIVSGGWEIQPSKAEMARLIKKQPNLVGYQPHLDRPPARPVNKD